MKLEVGLLTATTYWALMDSKQNNIKVYGISLFVLVSVVFIIACLLVIATSFGGTLTRGRSYPSPSGKLELNVQVLINHDSLRLTMSDLNTEKQLAERVFPIEPEQKTDLLDCLEQDTLSVAWDEKKQEVSLSGPPRNGTLFFKWSE